MLRFLPALILLAAPASHATATRLEFSPQRAEYQAAVDEYTTIWTADGPRIVDLLEKTVGATLPDPLIQVIVFEGVSNSGQPGKPMYLRASYPYDVKQATLVHELAHRYIDALGVKSACYSDVHEPLALVLTEVWGQLWGRRFAEAQSDVEAARSERYRRAWAGVMDKTPRGRKEALAALLQANCQKKH